MKRGFFIRWLAWGTGCLVGLCLLGTLAFIGGYAFLTSIVRAPEVQVPPVYGKPESEAIKLLAASGLSIQFPIDYQESDQYEDGIVIEQSPRSHIWVKVGRKVRLTVSRGAKRIMIPDLVAKKEEEILPALQHLGFEVGQRAAVYHKTVKAGVIIAQFPPPGEGLHFGKAVSILVSLGPEPKAYVMPNRIQSNFEKTKAAFSEMGFNVTADWEKVDTPDDWGRILDQDPVAGSKLLAKSEIVFTVGTRQIQQEREYSLPFKYTLPDTVTGQFVIVSVSEISGDEKLRPQTFKVPVRGPSDEIQLSIPYKRKIRVEVYDGAVEGGKLLYRNTFEAPSKNASESSGDAISQPKTPF